MSSLYCRDQKTHKLKLRSGIELNEKQKLLMQAKTKYIAYGGARGGGKSWAARFLSCVFCLKYRDLKILLIRRTYPELEANHIRPLQRELKGIATYKDAKKLFEFPNGSMIKLGHCDSDKIAISYQGQEYDIIIFEEATLFSEFMLQMIKTCLRSVRYDGFQTCIYYFCNPGGPSHHLIKRLFIDQEYEEGEDPNDYTFIPALVYDNKVLMLRDPGYIKILDTMPEEMRAAHRDGDWDALSGAYFKEFKKAVHVIEPIELDSRWYRYFVMDYGLDCLAAYWIAHDFENDEYYMYKEIWEKDLIISEAARRIKEVNGSDKIKYWYAPPDMKARKQDTGKTAIELFYANGVPLVLTRNDRIEGWLCVKEALKVYRQKDGTRYSKFHIFSNCQKIIKHIPIAQRDEKNPNDMATEPHDITHALDALRYFCIEYIKIPKLETPRTTGTWHRNELKMNGFTDAQINVMVKNGDIKLIGR